MSKCQKEFFHREIFRFCIFNSSSLVLFWILSQTTKVKWVHKELYCTFFFLTESAYRYTVHGVSCLTLVFFKQRGLRVFWITMNIWSPMNVFLVLEQLASVWQKQTKIFKKRTSFLKIQIPNFLPWFLPFVDICNKIEPVI